MSANAQAAIARLATQFRGKQRFEDLVSAIVGPLDGIATDLTDLRLKRSIDDAEGAQLDGIGDIVGEARLGRQDDEYRINIKFRIFLNTSKGTPPEIIRAVRFITQAAKCRYREVYPAAIQLYVDVQQITPGLADFVQQISPAGIGVVSIAVNLQGFVPFSFEPDAVTVDFALDDAGGLALDDGGGLQIAISQAEQGDTEGLGFAEVGFTPLRLDDGGLLTLNDGAALGVLDKEAQAVVSTEADQQVSGQMVEVFQSAV